MSNQNRFYVYEWFNKDTGEVFYVGKGSGYRHKTIQGRNDYFLNYYNKYKCDVRKIKEHLTEDDSFDFEIRTIKKYKDIGQCKCNLSDGGEGCTYGENPRSMLIQKLNAINNFSRYINLMPNEKEYKPESLKLKTYKELIDMYDNYYYFKEGIKTMENMKLIKNPDSYEAMMKDKEINMLTNMRFDKITSENKCFSKLKKCNTPDDFYLTCFEVDFDKMLDMIILDNDYYYELVNTIIYISEFIKMAQELDKLDTTYKIKSINVKDMVLNIKLKLEDIKGNSRVKIDMKDIVGGILIEKDKNLMDIIHSNIMMAELL